MFSVMSTESLAFQPRSKLYNQVSALCQEALDIIQPKIKVVQLSDKMARDELMKMRFPLRLVEIANEAMGPIFNRCFIESSPMGVNAYCGIDDVTMRGRGDSLGTLLEKYNRDYDDHSGKLNPKDDVKVKMFMGIYTGFFVLKTPGGEPYFTADEIAAIMLHEMGHADDFIRTSLRTIKVTTDSAEIVRYVQDHPSAENAMAVIETLKKKNHLDRTWTVMLARCEEYFKNNPEPSDPYFFEALGALCNSMNSSSLFNCAYISEMYESGEKQNRRWTTETLVDMERQADEFATRNGAGAAAVSGLHKMYQQYNSLSGTLAEMRRSPFLAYEIFAMTLTSRINEFINPSIDTSVTAYDPLWRRMELIVETMKHSFSKDPSEEVKVHYRKEIEIAENIIRRYKSSAAAITRKAILTSTKLVSVPLGVLFSPFLTWSRRSDDYTKLSHSTRHLTRNDFSYIADTLR
jgi:hypothetical protein